MNQHVTPLLGFRRSSFQAIDSINIEIDDELEFHISCRVADLIESGLSNQEAQQQAESEFGSREVITKQCQQINYGNRIVIGRIAIGAFMFSMLAIGWLGWQLLAERNANAELASQLNAMQLPSVEPLLNAFAGLAEDPTAVKGTITDSEGNPIANARVLLVVKSWPGGRFRMNPLATNTDSDGNYLFGEAFTKAAKSDFLVTVVQDGWLLTSKYVAGHDGSLLDPIDLKLAPALPQKLDFGKQYAGKKVFPNVRSSPANGDEHYVYPVSQGEFDLKIGDDGLLDLNVFAPGDELRFVVVFSDGRFEEVDVVVPGKSKNTKPKSTAKTGDLSGSIVDSDGNPIADAKVILVDKSWPKGRFVMKTARVRTDDDGKFLFSNRFKKGGNGQYLISVVADGWALDSQYIENPDGEAIESVSFKLAKAIEKTFVFKNADGSPAKKLNVFPMGCSREGKDDVYVYPVSSKFVKMKTDKEGKVTMTLFANGDTAKLGYLQAKVEGSVEVAVDSGDEQTVDIK